MKKPLKCLMHCALLYVIAMAIEGVHCDSQPMSHDDHGYCCVQTMRFPSGPMF